MIYLVLWGEGKASYGLKGPWNILEEMLAWAISTSPLRRIGNAKKVRTRRKVLGLERVTSWPWRLPSDQILYCVDATCLVVDVTSMEARALNPLRLKDKEGLILIHCENSAWV